MTHDHAPDRNDDDRLDLYFEHQAARMTLPAGDPGHIASRAQRRRHQRRAFAGGAATVVLGLGVVGIYATRTDQAVSVAGAPATTASTQAPEAALTWTTVDVPQGGLGWSTSEVAGTDGAVYSLSTAPGRPASDTQGNEPAILYRSDDGRTWSTAALPNGLRASALASSPGHLYAVGTAPAGGRGVDVVVATSSDGAGTWNQVKLPSADGGLKARFGDAVTISPPQLTSGPSGLVAAVVVKANPDVGELLQAKGIAAEAGWDMSPSGVALYQVDPACRTTGTAVPSGTILPSGAPMPPTTVPPDPAPSTTLSQADADAAKARAEAEAIEEKRSGVAPGCRKAPTVDRTLSWTDLGLPAELQAIIGGQVHVFTSSDGTAFTEAVPGGLAGVQAWEVSALVGSTDGYRLLASNLGSQASTQLFSPDGRNWTPTGQVTGWVSGQGTLAGNPAIVLSDQNGGSLLTAAVGGGWTRTDLAAALAPLGLGPRDAGLGSVAIGPLGIAAVVYPDQSDQSSPPSESSQPRRPDPVLVESRDGKAFTARKLSSLGDVGGHQVIGVTMNADAVIVRLGAEPMPADGPPTFSETQRLLVGTPA